MLLEIIEKINEILKGNYNGSEDYNTNWARTLLALALSPRQAKSIIIYNRKTEKQLIKFVILFSISLRENRNEKLENRF